MSRLRAIYKLLDGVEDESVDQALAAALPSADLDAAKLIGLKLLLRQKTEGMAAVVEQYHRLGGDFQQTVLRCVDRLDGALRVVCGRHTVQGSLNAIRIVRWSGAGRLAYLVVEQLKSRHEGVRRAAAECLLWLTEKYLSPGVDGENRGWVEDTGRVYEAVVEAVRSYPTHEDESVLRALAWFAPRPIHAGLRYLNDPKRPGTRAMAQMLAGAQGREVRRGMLGMVRVAALTEAVGRGLERAIEAGGFEDVLSGAHLLLDQRIARRFETFKDAGRLWPGGGGAAGWGAAGARGLTLWAAALPWAELKRVERLAELRGLSDDLARLGAVRRLMEIADRMGDPDAAQAAKGAIASYCHDPCEAVARVALRYLHRCGWEGLMNLLLSLLNSSHASVAQLAGELIRPHIFERVWQGWGAMSAGQRVAAGRAAIKIDPRYLQRLEEKLHDRDRGSAPRALAMIQTLGLAAGFEEQLVGLFREADDVVASAVVKALGLIDGTRAGGLVVEALGHPNDRVRANAIEALGRAAAGRHVPQLQAMADREHNRARANAIGVLVEVEEERAVDRLRRMLRDPGPMQRVSALWLVERLGMAEVAGAVGEMSVGDPDAKVRQRARRVFGRLIELMAQKPGEQTAQRVAA